MKVEIITPESRVFSGEAAAVSLPGSDGVFQVLNNHSPIISSLKEGLVKIEATGTRENTHPSVKNNGTSIEVSIKGGVVELMNNKLIVLAD